MSNPRPQRSAGKRKAGEDATAEQPTGKRIFAGHGRVCRRVADPAILSDEALFKIKHAAEFEGESAKEGPVDRIQVKQEPKDDDNITISPRRVTRSSTRRLTTDTPCRTKPTSNAVTAAEDVKTTSPCDDADQESIFVAILSQSIWGPKMTESAVDNLAHRARQAAANGALFDVAYVDSIIKRLDRTPVDSGRRSQVIELLREGLRRSLVQWSSRIDQVGSKTPPLSTLPDHRLATSQPSKPIAAQTPEPTSSKMLYVDVSPLKVTTAQSPRSQPSNGSYDSTSDSETEDSDDRSESEYRDHKREAPTENRGVRTSLADLGSSTVVDYDKIATNVRLYGTRYPKSAFDMLARCIIFAWAAAPHPDDTSINTREYALLRWRKVSGEQKCAWQKLFEERGDPASDDFQKSLQLLLSQDLLKLFVPENRLQAALLRCREQQPRPSAPVIVSEQPHGQATPAKTSYLSELDNNCTNKEVRARMGSFARREPFSSEYCSLPSLSLD